MGRDKALVQLAGKPLIEHAVIRLSRICSDVHILSNNRVLSDYAPLVHDLHPDCGPIAGIEAGLAHSLHDWNLFLPVDMPFLPTALIHGWTYATGLARSLATDSPGVRVLTVDGQPQPVLSLLHKAVIPFLSRSIRRGNYALMHAFEQVGRELPSGLTSVAAEEIPASARARRNGPSWKSLTAAQLAARPLWFLNLNTPEDLTLAQAHVAALDT